MRVLGFRRTWKCLSFIFALILVFSAVQPETTLAAPSSTIFRYSQLKLLPLYIEKTTICVGQKEKFAVLVTNEFGSIVPGASIIAKGKTFVTGADGIARWGAIAEKPGQDTLKVYATKKNYYDSAPYTTTIDVIECQWNLRMDYNEQYIGEGNSWVFEGSVEIEETPFTVNDDGTLSLLNGSSIEAQYHANVYEMFQPMNCTFSPPLDGPYSIQFKGNYENGLLDINLSAIPVALPKTVKIQCDPLDPNYQITPFNYPTGQRLDLINLAKLNTITMTGSGSYRKFSLNRMMLWPLGQMNYASGVLVIDRVKQ